MDAIILCGGLGTRIRTVTNDDIPKAMIPIQGKTILEWELTWLRKYNIKHAILAVRHLADYIEENLGDNYDTQFGSIEISYSKEKEKLGSGGAVRLARQFVGTDWTLIMNGDVITNFDLGSMIEHHHNLGRIATMALAKMRSPYGIVEVDKNDCIIEFREKPLLEHWIHAGVDIVSTDILSSFPEKGQMEDTIFVDLAKRKQFSAYKIPIEKYWRSIDTPKDFQEAEKDWKGL